MTPLPSQPQSFPGLTGETRKALDARLKPAGMTCGNGNGVFKGQFNHETLNKCVLQIRSILENAAE